MKRCKNITGWTDYPFESLGDQPGKRAPIRRVRVLSYDGNKYAVVQTQCGAIESIKRGYLYRHEARCDFATIINLRKLERMIPPNLPQQPFR